MSDVCVRYTNLDDFLRSQFLQDPLSQPSLVEVTDDFRLTRKPENVLAVATDIHRFLRDQHNDIDTAFDGFRPWIYPPGMAYAVADFLSEIADLLERPQDAQPTSRASALRQAEVVLKIVAANRAHRTKPRCQPFAPGALDGPSIGH